MNHRSNHPKSLSLDGGNEKESQKIDDRVIYAASNIITEIERLIRSHESLMLATMPGSVKNYGNHEI